MVCCIDKVVCEWLLRIGNALAAVAGLFLLACGLYLEFGGVESESKLLEFLKLQDIQQVYTVVARECEAAPPEPVGSADSRISSLPSLYRTRVPDLDDGGRLCDCHLLHRGGLLHRCLLQQVLVLLLQPGPAPVLGCHHLRCRGS